MMKTINLFTVLTLLWVGACAPAKQVAQQSKTSGRYRSITSGATWLDNNGKPIQAHGFSVFFKDGTYYWYGENKERTVVGSNVWTYGIRCYTSTDFYNWQDRGLIIPPDTTNPLSPLHFSQSNDRPHILYCPKTSKYVAWIKLMGKAQCMTVLQADNFLGPYKIVRTGYRPNGFESGDFDLYVDEQTGKGYLWAERPHHELICSTLTDDFTAVTTEFSSHFTGIAPPLTREAPVHFVREGKHYLYTSGTSGYYPNPSQVAEFSDYHGKYLDLGNPHPADTSNTSYCSQITDVIKIPGKKDLYVALADRWVPQVCGTNEPKTFIAGIMKAKLSNLYRERDTTQVQITDKSKSKRTSRDATSSATYVWLPITWENGVPKIYWKPDWKLEDYQ